MKYISNQKLDLANQFVNDTNQHIFLTGKAGTGKTTFLHHLKNHCKKRMIVVAPTGVAAINAGGVTIHSFFQLPFGPIPPSNGTSRENIFQNNTEKSKFYRFSREKKDIIRSLDLLVIDEISMVRADLLDGIDSVLRKYRTPSKPFGGVQLLMIGDLQQLAPVVKEEEWSLLSRYYASPFFFSSLALQQDTFVSIELRHIYRQSDSGFITLLNEIRENKLSPESYEKLNSRYQPEVDHAAPDDYITLTTHNAQAKNINQGRLKKLQSKSKSFRAEITGTFPEYMFPTEEELELKVNAQVMFVKNDGPQKRYYNGKIGKVVKIDSDLIHVLCNDSVEPIEVERVIWENSKYTINGESKEIEETITGTFEQFPLKLAWAITIHKSQGLTFDRVIIDAQAAFAHGQVYVALSRCRSLEGLILSTPISSKAIINNNQVDAFTNRIKENQPNEDMLTRYKNQYEIFLLKELFSFTSLSWGISQFLKLYHDNKSTVVSNISEKAGGFGKKFYDEVSSVSEKFEKQIDQLSQPTSSLEKNEVLKQRIKKACKYFLTKMHDIQEIFHPDVTFDTDNKQVKKAVNESIVKIRKLVQEKIICLEASMQEFSANHYLTIRGKAKLAEVAGTEKPVSASNKAKKETNLDHAEFPELFGVLKRWRQEKANEQGVPLYMIIPQKTMLSLCNFCPQSMKQLSEVKGLGKKKIQLYGEELLNILQSFEHLKPSSNTHVPLNVNDEVSKPHTREISLNLFRKNKAIHEIAQERGLQPSTIEGHLSHYIGTGEIALEQVVSKDKIRKIEKELSAAASFELKPVKEKLGDDFSYGEIRMVLAQFKKDVNS